MLLRCTAHNLFIFLCVLRSRRADVSVSDMLARS